METYVSIFIRLKTSNRASLQPDNANSRITVTLLSGEKATTAFAASSAIFFKTKKSKSKQNKNLSTFLCSKRLLIGD